MIFGFVCGANKQIMIAFKRAASLFLRSNAKPLAFNFSRDQWKERDEAAEKVFITQNESTLSAIQSKPSRNCWRKWRKTRNNGTKIVPISKPNSEISASSIKLTTNPSSARWPTSTECSLIDHDLNLPIPDCHLYNPHKIESKEYHSTEKIPSLTVLSKTRSQFLSFPVTIFFGKRWVLLQPVTVFRLLTI